MYTITKIINDTIPSYHINIPPEAFKEILPVKSNLRRDENDGVRKEIKTKLGLNVFVRHS